MRHRRRSPTRATRTTARNARFEPLFVEVFEANEKAVGFYRGRGFVDHERGVDEASGLSQLILRMARSDTT